MYKDYFGFRSAPFNMTPDTRFLFLSNKHEAAMANLLYGIRERKGFIVVTGEIGTGKTTLIRSLLNQLGADIHTAVILNPTLSKVELLHSILEDLNIKIPSENPSIKQLIDLLNDFLLKETSKGNNVAFIIDEAQNLTPDILEEIRLLSNIETEQEKLLQIILVGQPELGDLLDRPDLEQLRQRTAVRYHIEPLDEADVPRYIAHRLEIAGNGVAVTFTPGAMRRLIAYSKGIPRLINVICDKVLLACYAAEKREVTDEIMRRAINEHIGHNTAAKKDSASKVSGTPSEPQSPESVSWLRPILALGFLACLLIAILIMRTGIVQQRDADALVSPPSSDIELMSFPDGAFDADGVFRTERVDQTFFASVATLLNRWGVPQDELTPSYGLAAAMDPARLANAAGLQVLRFRGTLGKIEQFNLPAILPVANENDPRTTYIVLLGVDEEADLYTVADPLLGSLTVSRAIFSEFPIEDGLVFLPLSVNIRDPLKNGDSGNPVVRLQEELITLGEMMPPPPGIYGNVTTDAVRRFQQKHALEVDGIAGPYTLTALWAKAHANDPNVPWLSE